ncbi:hypothetical protein EVAR_6949_1 [Eumeta japonica]|uniref:Uncharacterized protein n=1 Tax=Eumeta variegata TaxID=151549 RepID=A0A4C1TJZ0_EUMVA|nr:hypothetical protein EVAR_6949_1 [Eumeta japonica]
MIKLKREHPTRINIHERVRAGSETPRRTSDDLGVTLGDTSPALGQRARGGAPSSSDPLAGTPTVFRPLRGGLHSLLTRNPTTVRVRARRRPGVSGGGLRRIREPQSYSYKDREGTVAHIVFFTNSPPTHRGLRMDCKCPWAMVIAYYLAARITTRYLLKSSTTVSYYFPFSAGRGRHRRAGNAAFDRQPPDDRAPPGGRPLKLRRVVEADGPGGPTDIFKFSIVSKFDTH